MSEALEYKGVSYVLPHNDDGAWRWMLTYSKMTKKAPPAETPRPVYATRGEAVAAAKRAIDAMLAKRDKLKTLPG